MDRGAPRLTVRIPPSYAAEREYVVRVLFEEFLGLRADVVVADVSATVITVAGGDRQLVLGDGLFSTAPDAWLSERSLPPTPLASFELGGTPFAAHPERSLPVLYGAPSWRHDDTTLELGVDVLGGAFYLLTRYEEVVLADRDEHERFPASANVMVREGLVRRPLVNEYLELLWLALGTQWPSLPRRRSAYSLVPSHDVDWPLAAERTFGRVARRAAGDVVRSRDSAAAARRFAGYAMRLAGRHDADVNNTFDAIMDASELNGLRSAFYFIAGRRAGHIDGDYSLDDPWIRSLLRRIHRRGHEIGLHASYTTPVDPDQTRTERDTLLRVLDEEGIVQERLGSRQHFLRWSNPQTWRNCEEAGIDYDTTLGFSDEIGFRAGTCLEYPVFDLRRRLQLRLRELPLIVMEGAVLDRLGLDSEGASQAIAELRRTCERYGGTFTLLWHNSRLVHRTERRLYFDALRR
jgi:hypothetical protein